MREPDAVGEGILLNPMTFVMMTFWKEMTMTQQQKMRIVRFMLSRLLEIATNGGFSLLALDMDTGRALFKIDPNDETVQEFIKAVPTAAVPA